MIACLFRALTLRNLWLNFVGVLACSMIAHWQASEAVAARGQFQATSKNFHVYAPDSRLAQKVAQEAERFREELAIEWLGHKMDDWSERCPIQVELGMHAGGETSFAFVTNGRSKGKPIGWQMKIFGPPDRLLDAVLPHEITHTIFATHFGRPLPRWADEGACTTVEHQSERNKNHQMLINFLSASPSRGIPFNRMFTMKQYPHDILPLYAQGHSVAKFIIMQKGRREFLNYLEAGMNRQRGSRDAQAWDVVTKEFYGFSDLSELQLAWIAWVKAGSIEQSPAASSSVALASYSTAAPAAEAANAAAPQPKQPDPAAQQAGERIASANVGRGWYARQMRSSGAPADSRVSTNRQTLGNSIRDKSADRTYLEDSRVGSQTLWR